MQTLRLGLIGTGNICRKAHIPQHVRVPEYTIAAIYDPNPDAARAAQEICLREYERCGRAVPDNAVTICSSAQELLEQVDFVDICTTLKYHAYYAALALEHGVSAMSEKPMARTWLEAQQVAANARDSSAYYQLNDDNLFIPRFLTAKALIDAGWIGDLQSVRISRGTPSSRRAQWFYDPIEAGGGAIMDYGSHAVSNVWSVIGYDKIPTEVSSMGIVLREKTRLVEGRVQNVSIDDDAHFKILFRDPRTNGWITACVEATWTWQHFGPRSSDVDGTFEAEGSLGRLSTKVDENGTCYLELSSHTMGQRRIPVENVLSEEQSFFSEFQSFARSILLRKQPYLNAENGAEIIAILNAAQLSEQKSRRAVSLEELKSFSRSAAAGQTDVWRASDNLAADFNRQFFP